jgi:hypothetical protein
MGRVAYEVDEGFVEVGYAVPENVTVRCLEEECSLTDAELLVSLAGQLWYVLADSSLRSGNKKMAPSQLPTISCTGRQREAMALTPQLPTSILLLCSSYFSKQRKSNALTFGSAQMDQIRGSCSSCFHLVSCFPTSAFRLVQIWPLAGMYCLGS